MKTRLTPDTPAKKAVLLAIALAVVVGMSYLGSEDYLNQSIMEMLMGGSQPCSCSYSSYCNCTAANECANNGGYCHDVASGCPATSTHYGTCERRCGQVCTNWTCTATSSCSCGGGNCYCSDMCTSGPACQNWSANCSCGGASCTCSTYCTFAGAPCNGFKCKCGDASGCTNDGDCSCSGGNCGEIDCAN